MYAPDQEPALTATLARSFPPCKVSTDSEGANKLKSDEWRKPGEQPVRHGSIQRARAISLATRGWRREPEALPRKGAALPLYCLESRGLDGAIRGAKRQSVVDAGLVIASLEAPWHDAAVNDNVSRDRMGFGPGPGLQQLDGFAHSSSCPGPGCCNCRSRRGQLDGLLTPLQAWTCSSLRRRMPRKLADVFVETVFGLARRHATRTGLGDAFSLPAVVFAPHCGCNHGAAEAAGVLSGQGMTMPWTSASLPR